MLRLLWHMRGSLAHGRKRFNVVESRRVPGSSTCSSTGRLSFGPQARGEGKAVEGMTRPSSPAPGAMRIGDRHQDAEWTILTDPEYLAGEQNANVNFQCISGWTALILAATNGFLEVVHYLAGKQKANANSQDSNGTTALLHVSCVGSDGRGW